MLYGVVAVAAVLAVVLLASALRRKAAYYQQVFTEEHLAEAAEWLLAALKLGPVDEPRFEDGSAYKSSAGCAFTFTRDIGEKDLVHIAVSQVGGVTTHAVAGRFAFLFLQILKENRADADFYYTESGVHHLVFLKETAGDWLANDARTAVAMMPHYEPLPFRFESVPSHGNTTDA